jgi:hypothetical protein
MKGIVDEREESAEVKRAVEVRRAAEGGEVVKGKYSKVGACSGEEGYYLIKSEL